MLDIAQLRKDPETAAARLATRGYVLDLEAFRALEAEHFDDGGVKIHTR